MSRALPVVRAGGWYHVVHRGVDRSVIFPDSRTKDDFIERLGDVAHTLRVEVHAYCAMETHYHLLARATGPELWRAIVRLEECLPKATERARVRRLEVGRHLLGVTRYIHRNPVDAGLVRHPGLWRWSSYRGYLDPLDGPSWLRSGVVLGWLGLLGCRLRYRSYVEMIEINMSNMYDSPSSG